MFARKFIADMSYSVSAAERPREFCRDEAARRHR